MIIDMGLVMGALFLGMSLGMHISETYYEYIIRVMRSRYPRQVQNDPLTGRPVRKQQRDSRGRFVDIRV